MKVFRDIVQSKSLKP